MLCAGQVYRSRMQIGDGSEGAQTAILTVMRPDGTTVLPGVVNDPPGSGFYYVDYLLDIAGLYQLTWVSIDPGTAPVPNFINVRQFASIVSLEEMKDHLNKNKLTVSPDDDGELANMMMASTEVVEDRVGICVPRQFTDRIDAGHPSSQPLQLLVPHYPVLSVVSVTSAWAGGPAWVDPGDGSLLAADGDAGIIYQPSGFAFWMGPWDVVTRTGRAAIPERWVLAAKEQCRHLWETQRGAMPPAVLANEEVFSSTVGFTFSIPRRVLELLETDMAPSS